MTESQKAGSIGVSATVLVLGGLYVAGTQLTTTGRIILGLVSPAALALLVGIAFWCGGKRKGAEGYRRRAARGAGRAALGLPPLTKDDREEPEQGGSSSRTRR